MKAKHINFITGKLAEPGLTKLLRRMAPRFSYDVVKLPAQVASLMTTGWVTKRLPENLTGKIIIPGGCNGDLNEIREKSGLHTLRGPEDFHGLPEFFGGRPAKVKYKKPKLQIIAEIVDAPNMTVQQIVKRAKAYKRDGADWIDIGCMPGVTFGHLGDSVRELRRLKLNVSVDSFNKNELLTASKAGARMFLSVNSLNIGVARKLKGKVVVIPDFGKGLTSLYKNARTLEKQKVNFIMDPILDPLPFGAAESISRYATLRKKFPGAQIMMGVGNLTELTAADNIGLSALLGGVCAELDIDYVLTTEVAGWNRDSVRQIAAAREIMEHAVSEGILPKGFDNRLLVARDAAREPFTARELKTMSRNVKDKNFRIFVSEGFIHVFNREVYIKTKTAEGLFEKLDAKDASHAYYLGKEIQKAETALKLGKNYMQEAPLDWGYITSAKGRKK